MKLRWLMRAVFFFLFTSLVGAAEPLLAARGPARSMTATPPAHHPVKPPQQLQGNWSLSWGHVSNVIYTVNFTNTTLTARHVRTGRVVGSGSYQIDPNAGTIDVSGTSGQYEGKAYHGLIAVHGNGLVWCMGNANQPRPTQFTHDPSSHSYFVILQPKN